MTPAFTARKRAEEFNSLIEGSSTSERDDARYVELFELIAAIREVPQVEARPAFVADLRERLMLAADSALAPSTATASNTKASASVQARLTVAPRRTPRERRIAVAMGGFAIVGATTSMAVAAQGTLPGDLLYPLKRAIENAHAGVQVDEVDKGSTLLANAKGRLSEVDELSRDQGDQGNQDGLVIAETLQDFTDQATAASDLLLAAYQNTGQQGSIEKLRQFTADSMLSLTKLEGVVPDEARAALIQAAQVLNQIDTQALTACPACLGKGLTEIPEFAVTPVVNLLGINNGAQSAPPIDEAKPNNGKPGKGKGGTGNPASQPETQPGTTPPPILTPPNHGNNNNGNGNGNGNGNNGPGPSHDPIGDLTDGLTGGGGGTSTSNPGVGEILEDVIGGVTGGITGITGPLLP